MDHDTLTIGVHPILMKKYVASSDPHQWNLAVKCTWGMIMEVWKHLGIWLSDIGGGHGGVWKHLGIWLFGIGGKGS